MIPRPSLPLSIIFESSKKGLYQLSHFPSPLLLHSAFLLPTCGLEKEALPPPLLREQLWEHLCFGPSYLPTDAGELLALHVLKQCWIPCRARKHSSLPSAVMHTHCAWAMDSPAARKPHPSPGISQPPAGSLRALPVPPRGLTQSQELNREEIPVNPSNHSSSPPIPHFLQILCKGFQTQSPEQRHKCRWRLAMTVRRWLGCTDSTGHSAQSAEIPVCVWMYSFIQ